MNNLIAAPRRQKGRLMNNLFIVTAATMKEVIDAPSEFPGLYITLDGNGKNIAIVACDNSTGDAWTEEFGSLVIACRWLFGELSTKKAHKLDKALNREAHK